MFLHNITYHRKLSHIFLRCFWPARSHNLPPSRVHREGGGGGILFLFIWPTFLLSRKWSTKVNSPPKMESALCRQAFTCQDLTGDRCLLGRVPEHSRITIEGVLVPGLWPDRSAPRYPKPGMRVFLESSAQLDHHSFFLICIRGAFQSLAKLAKGLKVRMKINLHKNCYRP